MEEIEAFLGVGCVVHKRRHGSSGIAFWLLDLDDIRPEVGVQLGAVSTETVCVVQYPVSG
jgi:hypothetical protein